MEGVRLHFNLDWQWGFFLRDSGFVQQGASTRTVFRVACLVRSFRYAPLSHKPFNAPACRLSTTLYEKNNMDMSLIRDSEINMHQLINTDKECMFYYDETNNIRKLLLTPNGLNVPQTDNFVLAGIMTCGKNIELTQLELNSILRLSSSEVDIKFKQVAKGRLDRVLKSRNLGSFFQWVLDNDIYIHYSDMNILYWSLTDIIDSVIEGCTNNVYIQENQALKSILYDIVKSNELEFLAKLRQYDYPNIKKENINEFSNWLLSFVKYHGKNLPRNQEIFITSFFNNIVGMEELLFLMGGEDHVLIDNFMVNYIRNVYMFNKSIHIFDEEHQIQKLMEGFSMSFNGAVINNYQFKESTLNPEIQLADIITGFFGKYFSFIKNTNIKQLMNFKSQLNSVQKNNLKLLKELIDKSDCFSKALFHRVASQGEIMKNNLFLHEKTYNK